MSPELGQREAEEILYREAFLIDERRFDEWASMFTPDGIYWVPLRWDSDPEREISIIYDNGMMRSMRVRRLKSQFMWAQDPPSKTCHLIANVWIEEGSGPEVTVYSNQAIFETRADQNSVVAARCTHRLRRVSDEWKITLKKSCLLNSDQFMGETIVLV